MRFEHAYTFRDAAISYLLEREFAGAAPATLRKMESLLRRLLPWLGPRPIEGVTLWHVMYALRWKVKRGKRDMVWDAVALTNAIIEYAIECERFESDNPCDWLPRKLKKPLRKGLRLAQRPDELGKLMAQLSAYHGDPAVRNGLQVLAHTLVMPMRARFATWDQLDLDAGLWRLPEVRSAPERIVFLSDQAVALFRELESPRRSNRWVFCTASHRERPLSDMTFTNALRIIADDEKPFTAGSFRKSARHHLALQGYDQSAIKRLLTGLPPSGLHDAADLDAPYDLACMAQGWSDQLDRLTEDALAV